MKKNLLSSIVALLSLCVAAQTSEQLVSVNQFSNLTAMNAVSNPTSGALAYNLDNNSLYYYNGTTWVQTNAATGWGLNGNFVNYSTFLGSTNNEPIRFRVNNVQKWSIESNGNLVPTEDNIAIGINALMNTAWAHENVAIGINALRNNNGGDYNIAIGRSACHHNSTGLNNVAVGGSSLASNNSSSEHVALGVAALYSHNSGNYNTAIGTSAMRDKTSGGYNTALGYFTYPSGNYTNSTAIGASVNMTASYQVRIGHNVTSIGGPQSWSQISDKRFKENIKENVLGLDFIMGLKPVTYNINFKDLNYHHSKGVEDTITSASHYKELYDDVQIGFLAQDVEALADSLNFEFHGVEKPQNPEGSYALRYAEFVAPLVKAMQEQQAMIENLNNKIESQNSKISKQDLVIKSLIKKLEQD